MKNTNSINLFGTDIDRIMEVVSNTDFANYSGNVPKDAEQVRFALMCILQNIQYCGTHKEEAKKTLQSTWG